MRKQRTQSPARHPRNRASLFLATIALTCFTPTVLAQAEVVIQEEKSALKPWIAMLVFSAGIIAIAFKNPKRSHNG